MFKNKIIKGISCKSRKLFPEINNSPIKLNENYLRKSFTEELKLEKEKVNQGFHNFEPDQEILKFYKQYLYDKKETTKIDYEKSFKTKLNYIEEKSKMINKGENIITIKVNKFMGILEYKSQLQEILQIITERVATTEDTYLQELSEYYFKQSGKMIRPYLLISISKYIYECLHGEENKNDYFNSVVHKKHVLPFAACVEVLHNASLLHDDIIDNSDKRRNHATAHNLFGIRNTVFGANFIISKASRVITEMEVKNLDEIYASMVYYLTYGECKQSLNNNNLEVIDNSFKVYMVKTYYKTASLIALGLRGIGCIYNLDISMQKKLFDLGLHIGIVFQLVDDVMDVLYDSNKMKKPAFKDLTEGVINSHILFEIEDETKTNNAIYSENSVLKLAKRKFKAEGDIQKIIEILNLGKGIIKTQNLSLDHMLECYKILDDPFFKNTSSKSALYQCFNFLINRNY